MKVHDFIQKIKGRYPKLNEEAFTIKDMEEGLKYFSDMNRESLFEAFKNEYVYTRSPRWADFNKIAINAGIHRAMKNPLKHAFYVCDECNTSYSAEGRYCPKCHIHTSFTVSAGERPSDFMLTRADCGQCKLYKGNGSDGCICPDFGGIKTHRFPQCKDCVCHHCCWETLAITEGLAGDTAKFDKLTQGNKWENRLLDECKEI